MLLFWLLMFGAVFETSPSTSALSELTHARVSACLRCWERVSCPRDPGGYLLKRYDWTLLAPTPVPPSQRVLGSLGMMYHVYIPIDASDVLRRRSRPTDPTVLRSNTFYVPSPVADRARAFAASECRRAFVVRRGSDQSIGGGDEQ